MNDILRGWLEALDWMDKEILQHSSIGMVPIGDFLDIAKKMVENKRSMVKLHDTT